MTTEFIPSSHLANLISFPNLTQLPISKLILQCWLFQHMTSVTKVNNEVVIYAHMNSIKTNITSHKCQFVATFVIFLLFRCKCKIFGIWGPVGVGWPFLTKPPKGTSLPDFTRFEPLSMQIGSGVFPLGEATKKRTLQKSHRDVIFHLFVGNSPLNQFN